MAQVKLHSKQLLGTHFIPEAYLPENQSEYYLRNKQVKDLLHQWRQLKSDEIERLVKNGNSADNWDDIQVTDCFDPDLIRNNEFHGLVRIGRIEKAVIEHHDLQLATGITNSTIVACDIGDDVAIHNVKYMSHYIIGNQCILLNIDEMHTTNHAKFGNGVVMEGEPEQVRKWLDLMNETGSRAVLPFDGMTTADAYLWAKYRDDEALQKQLKTMTQNVMDTQRGYYGTVGDYCVIKHARILKDVKIGSHCYIKGANKLKNITINSNEEEQTQIGESVELVNGIIGYGCHIFYGCKAVRFILGSNSNLKYSARLIHSFLGDNSTISCCEVLNNLIFPAHEQHHNNSFLVASVLLGQSNMAAGATIGSNHNSRANDNEVQAGRGFWPGLCTSIKHSSRFASYILLIKGDYPAEMDIPLPFSYLNNNVSDNQLEIMPAFWWRHNMYALARNNWKVQARDKRKTKTQNIEFDAFAPDTIEEILHARKLLEIWTAKAILKADNKILPEDTEELVVTGKKWLSENTDKMAGLRVLGEHIEKSRRDAVILYAAEGYYAYEQMLFMYSMKNLIAFIDTHPDSTLAEINQTLNGVRITQWVNLGGQLCTAQDVDQLRQAIGSGKLNSWDAIHQHYNHLWKSYPLQKQKHAYAVLCQLLNTQQLSLEQWHDMLDKAVNIQEYICEQVYRSRLKDYENPFRKATYRNEKEMLAAIGTIEDNSFVKQVREETKAFQEKINQIKQNIS